MSRVIDAGGAQILPPASDDRAKHPVWVAHCCADADLRVKSAPHRAIAETLQVVP